MRWESKDSKNKRLVGTTRIIRKFLYFPKEMDGEKRWLEIVYIEQRRCRDRNYLNKTKNWWDDVRWVDSEEKKTFEKEKLTKLIRKLIREKENDTNVFKIFEKIMHEEPKHKKCF